VKGLPWTVGAISNAKWTGPKLRDVIVKYFGGAEKIPPTIKHVHLTGRDNDGNGQYYAVSIPIERALDERSDVILALEMNDQPLPLDHGAPIRVVVPGAAGCRSVKWLHKIELSEKESDAFWQKEDYKSFSPSQGWKGLDFNTAPSVMSTPAQSAICNVAIKEEENGSKYAVLKGYAFSGGGNAIIRVDVSADGGKTWTNANLEGEHENVANGHLPYRRTYSWTLWEAVIEDVKRGENEFVVKAVDETYNSQPEKPDGIWNVRGILNNSWHRVTG
jgi:sulfite oxidase